MYPSFRGRKLNKSNYSESEIQEIAFLIGNKKEENFKNEFSKAAATRFGSGWAWLCAHENGTLEICSTANQDNPLMPNGCGGNPILCLDVWEHAYYLNYQNRRPDYIQAFFEVVDWSVVSDKFTAAQ